eukprot:3813774-Pleurochrysis_carterae.AAC.2
MLADRRRDGPTRRLRRRRREAHEREEHTAEHRQKRYHAHDIWTKSEKEPTNVTALNIDAPTQDQFDIPLQDRNARDVVKTIETHLTWKSKITGVMSAGWVGMGMLAYVARFGLGSGTNLTCTTLYLMLFAIRQGLAAWGPVSTCSLITCRVTPRTL